MLYYSYNFTDIIEVIYQYKLNAFIAHTNMVIKRLAKKVWRIFQGPVLGTKTVYIEGVPVGREHTGYIIAEIGINHNGDLNIAKQLIAESALAGCQAVKLQKRTIEDVYSKEELEKPRAVDVEVLKNAIARGVLSPEAVDRLTKSDFKDSTNGDLKYALEFTLEEYKILKAYAEERGIHFFASPWDVKSVDVLEEVGVPAYKIASASLTDDELLRKVHATGKPIILSTGMSSLEQVRHAVDVLGVENLILLHTISTYPAEDKNINLRLIPALRSLYPTVPIGYSGHEKGLAISVAATTLGAHVIERHVTLDKNMFGSDQKASIEPGELKELVEGIRAIESAFGDGVKRVLEEEIPIREKLRRV
jgi:N-acetylneuraminate synthase